jgi:hypothetical protein
MRHCVFISLALLGIAAPQLLAQDVAQHATPDSSQCDLIDADRPGLSDGSHVIGAGKIQLETGYVQERHVDGDVRSRVTLVPTLLRIGLTSRLEARLESNTLTHERVLAPPDSVASSTGLSPIFLGAKLLFYGSTDSALSVATIVRIVPPSGTAEFRSNRAAGDVRVVADWDFAPDFSLNPNIGYARYVDSDGTRFGTALGALTLSWQPTPRFSPFVNVAYQSREEAGGSWAMVVDAGAAYIVGCDVQLDLSAGQNVHGVTAPKPFVAAGISLRGNLFHRSTHPIERLHGDRPAQPARI